MVILQDDNDDYKSLLVSGTPITQQHLGFNIGEDSNTGTSTGENVEGSTSTAKDDGKSGTPYLEMLLQSEVTSDGPITSWFGDVNMLDSTAILLKKWERKRHISSLLSL